MSKMVELIVKSIRAEGVEFFEQKNMPEYIADLLEEDQKRIKALETKIDSLKAGKQGCLDNYGRLWDSRADAYQEIQSIKEKLKSVNWKGLKTLENL